MLQQMDPGGANQPLSWTTQLGPGRIPPGRRVRGGAAAPLRERALARAREELVRRFMPLARSLALRYRRQTRVARRPRPGRRARPRQGDRRVRPRARARFAAYAVPTILGELRRHFRDHVWNVRLPRGLQELTMKVDEATSRLTEELGRVPDPDRDRRAARDLGRGRARGDRGRPRAPHPLARRPAPQPTTRTPRPALETLGGADPGYDRVEAELASDAAEPRRARVAGAADALRRRAHPAGDRRPARRLADADLADQPAGAVEAAHRRARDRRRGPFAPGSCSP